MERRTILKAGLLASAAGLPAFVSAQSSGAAADLDYQDFDQPFPPTYRLYGTSPALGEEEDKARLILEAAPKNDSLLNTARYFENLKDINGKGYQYNAQWPDVPGGRWNPVLIGFYQATSLDKTYVYKRGDTIDWCAAFVNWCLVRAGYKDTDSAMSGSFRKYGVARGKDEAPVAGDIIVFRKAGESGDKGHGHVAIYLATEANGGYRVLGGNQKAGKKFSSVNTTVFAANNPNLMLHSIRAIDTMKA